MNKQERAMARYEAGLIRVKETSPPEGQKFLPGEFVTILKNLPSCMSHFESGIPAMVEHTHSHAYHGDDIDYYSLLIRSNYSKKWISVSWYEENQLEKIEDMKMINNFRKEIKNGRFDA